MSGALVNVQCVANLCSLPQHLLTMAFTRNIIDKISGKKSRTRLPVSSWNPCEILVPDPDTPESELLGVNDMLKTCRDEAEEGRENGLGVGTAKGQRDKGRQNNSSLFHGNSLEDRKQQ
ncbi:hypothetical protein HBI17_106770 [Parastagonospora nodorum]|nr:hypothetical protein HBH52_149320 [Parastagonospora nodorum]KAH4188651.1 hypothetical protein HBH42_148670 [Parastagonospora nodorum]KAH4968456.1 hypothetical protein HBI78_069280 [Parastagonospora nodorum]KAH5100145.1 hypothetical protein HBH72_105030 [Parastagonospora nodorum]KAH5124970.1 hypothetical protein HBH71_000660 [Parastagonospora nodorum]